MLLKLRAFPGKFPRRNKQGLMQFCSLDATIPTITDLISKQHWSELKTHLQSTEPQTLLQQLLTSGADSVLILRGGDMKAARKMMDEMVAKGLRADVVTYDTVIISLCSQRKLRMAVRLLDEMLVKGVRPSHMTYNTLMEGYCMEGNLKAAVNMRMRMEKDGKRANVVTFNVLIKGFCDKGKLEDANGLLNEMLENGLVPNRITYEIIRVEMLEKGFVPDIEGHLYNISSSS